MAVELKKLADDLSRKGYEKGSVLLRSLAPILESAGVIPERLYEYVPGERPPELPPYRIITHDKDITSPYRYEFDILKLSERARTSLFKGEIEPKEITIEMLYYSLDEELLSFRRLGPSGRWELRDKLAQFRQKVVDARERLGITDDTPVVFK